MIVVNAFLYSEQRILASCLELDYVYIREWLIKKSIGALVIWLVALESVMTLWETQFMVASY